MGVPSFCCGHRNLEGPQRGSRSTSPLVSWMVSWLAIMAPWEAVIGPLLWWWMSSSERFAGQSGKRERCAQFLQVEWHLAPSFCRINKTVFPHNAQCRPQGGKRGPFALCLRSKISSPAIGAMILGQCNGSLTPLTSPKLLIQLIPWHNNHPLHCKWALNSCCQISFSWNNPMFIGRHFCSNDHFCLFPPF